MPRLSTRYSFFFIVNIAQIIYCIYLFPLISDKQLIKMNSFVPQRAMAQIENGLLSNRIAILDAGAQYGKVN